MATERPHPHLHPEKNASVFLGGPGGPPPKGEGAGQALDDEFYESLIETHQGLSLEQSQALNARLILLLANHIGSLDILREALTAARGHQPSP
jgi:hypothetical protein